MVTKNDIITIILCFTKLYKESLEIEKLGIFPDSLVLVKEELNSLFTEIELYFTNGNDDKSLDIIEILETKYKYHPYDIYTLIERRIKDGK